MVALVLPALAAAQETSGETTLSAVRVSERVMGEKTEGSGSYTTGKTKTATPLSLSPRDTPQSVSVMTQQRIEDQGLLNITDVVNNVTGVSVNQYETHRAQFHARGFDINTLMVDGVPTTWDQQWSSGEIMTGLAIYDRVEVVRGSTGLTTGAGDPSAAINLVRKRASSKELTGTLQLGYGSWNEMRGMLDVATPVNEAKTLRARIVGEYVERGSWVDNLENKNQTVLATFEADLTPDTLLSAGISRQENSPRGSMWGGLPVWYSDGSKANWDRSKTTAADWTRWDSTYENYFATLEHRFANNWKVKASYSHGDRKADSYLLYLYGTPDRTTGLGLFSWPGSYQVHTQQEDFGLQANGPFALFGRMHELALGYTYAYQRFTANSRAASTFGSVGNFNAWNGKNFPEPSWGAPTYYGKGETRQEALFAAARINIADPLKVILGSRLTRYEKSGDDASTSPYTIKINDQLTPYAGIIYDLNDNLSLYASYTDIFQPQQRRDISGKFLDPVIGKSTEGGVKGEFFGGRLNASLAVFRIAQENLAQSTGQTIPGTTPPETAYRASKGATSDGYELELAGELMPDWNVSAGYTHFKAKDAKGADVNSIYPRELLKLFTTYRLPGALNALTVGGGVNWQGATYTFVGGEKFEQKAYALVNLMTRYDFSKQLSAQLNVNNLFDKTYYGMFDAYNQYTYGAPRNATLTLKYRF